MPVYRMSVKLLATYEHINEVYYTKKRARLAAEALKQKSKVGVRCSCVGCGPARVPSVIFESPK